MEWMREWGVAVCSASVACAILQLLIPNNRIGRLWELIAAAVLSVCILSPLVRVDWQWITENFSGVAETSVGTDVSKAVVSEVAQSLEESVFSEATAALSSYGWTLKKTEVLTDIGEDGGIYISGILAFFPKESDADLAKAQSVLEDRFRVSVQVSKGSG